MDVGLHTFGSNVGLLALATQKTFIAVGTWNVRNNLFDIKIYYRLRFMPCPIHLAAVKQKHYNFG